MVTEFITRWFPQGHYIYACVTLVISALTMKTKSETKLWSLAFYSDFPEPSFLTDRFLHGISHSAVELNNIALLELVLLLCNLF